MNAARIEAELRVLLDALSTAEGRGDAREAQRLLAKARALAPNHEAVLNAQAINALRAGNVAAGRHLLERAVARNPSSAALWLNLASACRDASDAAAERAALERCLELEPRNFIAHLAIGGLLERSGQEFEAAGAYQAALACAPIQSQVPPALVPRLNHALERVRAQSASMDAALEAALAPVRAAQVGFQSRFEHGLAAMLGKARIYPSQPTFLQVPYLPAPHFFAREAFAWLATLEAATEAIAGEARAVLAEPGVALAPYVAFETGAAVDTWRELNHSPRWSALHLYRDGAPVAENLSRCPATAALLAGLPLADLPGNAPNVYFSVLAPKTRIPPHHGVTNARVICHLPLLVPSGCQLRVGAEVRDVVAGESLVFDDTIEHEAVNDSEQTRVVLVMDAWNPFVSEDERALLRATFSAAAAFTRRPSMFHRSL
jgi:aspartate beta-hydroxylase